MTVLEFRDVLVEDLFDSVRALHAFEDDVEWAIWGGGQFTDGFDHPGFQALVYKEDDT